MTDTARVIELDISGIMKKKITKMAKYRLVILK